ncbi:sigma factor-like helix-turn-helix DNA-binding protein [Streptomyces europaeiscabiei]|uniref:Sigma factor-like helix-turn-helix DNA-binding protein n=1 Tax=Streptomyces europaeiscabiei TaxID=146819 RepID=A0ABU4ND37_9ACTN|nr:sigma factor-like helix-turn-helix DNA-binding protein [Streptomyces europaeiscabiei]MDX3541619.1 sigma factor-like helix-turn-helix DNA-binding protein [Streptomyces europaeiscabiei]MDX3551960.1 sigma factor-like helix-turn-helix DNA-binding protein [Streptomyces europaeiscabiei]MDX3700199.1 sigma factor-like helix-turn-helix DNA-binding protein [Streptomyces europaeiscabiei]
MYDVTNELRSIRRTRKTVNAMVWVIVTGAVFYSLMTTTPLVAAHSEWEWSGWALGILTDAAFILSISADATLSRHGIKGGRWPTAFRWTTGLASLFLNTWSSVSERDWVGVAIHSIAPAILICAAEVSPHYRRKFRDLELTLTEEVTVKTVTQSLTPKRSQPARTTNGQGKPEKNKAAIRQAFLDGLTPTQAAEKIGVTRGYVSQRYKEIREELKLTA